MTTTSAIRPKVFISYSHDSQAHKDAVLQLANKLNDDGIDCTIDQYIPSPSEGWPRWMMNQIEQSNFVLMICTETYGRRVRGQGEPDKGKGADWEGAIITQEIYDSRGRNDKFIPVIFVPKDAEHIPVFVRAVAYYRPDLADGYEQLYRRLTDQHDTPKPEPGPIKIMPPKPRPPKPPEPITKPVDSSPLEKVKRRSLVFWVGAGAALLAFFTMVASGWYWVVTHELETGRAFLNIGRYADAHRPYRLAAWLCPFCPEASLGLAIAEIHDPNQSESYEDMLTALLKSNPNNPHVQIAAGDLAAYQRKFEQAIEYFRKAGTADPPVAEAHYRLGMVYQWQGDLPDALTSYKLAIKLVDSPPPHYLVELAGLYIELGNYDEADRYYQQLDSRFLRGRQELALLRRLQDRLPQALDHLRELVRLLDDSNVTDMYFNQDPWYYKYETDAGVQGTVEFHPLERKKAYIYYTLSSTLYLLGRDNEALEYLEKARALRNSKDEEVKVLVSYDLRQLGEKKPQWRVRSEDYRQRFLASTAGL